MLVLSRKANQVLCIGPDIRITIVETNAKSVRLGIDAPFGLRIYRPGETGPELPAEPDDADSINTECRESLSKERERRLKSQE